MSPPFAFAIPPNDSPIATKFPGRLEHGDVETSDDRFFAVVKYPLNKQFGRHHASSRRHLTYNDTYFVNPQLGVRPARIASIQDPRHQI